MGPDVSEVVVARSDRASEGERDLKEENARLRQAVLELRLLNDLAREIGALAPLRAAPCEV
jgi:hypothetical protein